MTIDEMREKIRLGQVPREYDDKRESVEKLYLAVENLRLAAEKFRIAEKKLRLAEEKDKRMSILMTAWIIIVTIRMMCDFFS